MKTFKLISLQVVDSNQLVNIPLEDGLIINKEDEHNTWLLEGYILNTYKDVFQKSMDDSRELHVRVVITKKDNAPASFQVKTLAINKFDEHFSVLLQGKLRIEKNDYAEHILQDLLQKGFEGEELLAQFKAGLQRN